jgi:hypothetical protein
MRYMIVIFAAVSLFSCNKKVITEKPLGYSVMPKYMDIDSIAPYNLDDTNRVVDSTYEDFKSIPIDGGWLKMDISDSIQLPPGILFSDRKAVLYVFYRESWKRQKTELKYCKYLMKEYYEKAKTAEQLYQKEILRLEKLSERSWLEKNMAYMGFGAGIVTSILIVFALFGSSNIME